MTSGRPFDDIRALTNSMPQSDEGACDHVRHVIENFGAYLSPLGRNTRYAKWLAGWQGKAPSIDRPLIAVFAGSHGVAKHVFGGDVIPRAQARVKSMTEGAAGVRGISSSLQAAFKVYELGIEYPAADFTDEPSLTEKDCAAAIAFGMEVVAEGADIIALGNAGFGTATAAAAIALGLYGGTAEYWAGGEGEAASSRINAVAQGATLHKNLLSDPLEVLRCFGGRDIAGMVGAILAARHQAIPIILDGYVVCAAAAVLHKLDPNSIAHCMAGHVTAEPAHRALLDRMGLEPMHDMGIGIGDGTGAAFALGSLRSTCQALATLKTA
ncbi:nicotinate-nucleotide--dimethylbenzimidazole phosphoribosyltransferase [Hellea balneolensis]|uniref:nicotinate-nucleotide--dimethylbenzimidazole phosphoribosyltransferase n=1 Tax=Hellea balneolensis TaxID=287478 RepID=UPI0003F6564B|nr:nicotinate-nucleotide--dimethylbenzimidazole phosphoribosyltransferase [Hellea balneolensis]